MSQQTVLELIGYLASGLVAVSLMMSSILRLRLLNLLGSIVFTVYGVLIHAYPVAVVNAFIVLINLYYLRGMLAAREYFRLLEVKPDSEYLGAFLDFYAEQVQHYFPGFRYEAMPELLTLFVLRDMVPAGLLIGEQRGDVLHVHLDFVIPQYRDVKIARCLYGENVEFFRARGIAEIVSAPGSPAHAKYLRRMGFSASGGDSLRLALP